MKISKKLIVSSLASAMAISLVGAVSGTVAWFQYNTRVTTSLIGMNAGETGVLEISADNGSTWKRDVTSADIKAQTSRANFNLTPMTFAGANMTATSALPANAYKNPDKSSKAVVEDGSDYATRGNYATNWDEATAAKDYIQYSLKIRGKTVDKASGGFIQTAEDVYLTDFSLAKIGTADITEAMRVHLAIDADGNGTPESYLLLSKSAVSGIALHGMLDQDGDGFADRIGGYEWAEHRDDHIDYGKGNNYTQTTDIFDDHIAERDDANGYAIKAAHASRKLFTTPTSGATIVTVTIWVEGWDRNIGEKTVTSYEFEDAGLSEGADCTGKYVEYKLPNGDVVEGNYVLTGDATAQAGVDYFTRTANASTKVADWSGEGIESAMFQFGLTFDVGRGSFAD